MNKEEMTKEIAVEIATKYANDIWLFGEVDKDCVSKVCKTLLNELDITNKKLKEVKENIIGYSQALAKTVILLVELERYRKFIKFSPSTNRDD